MSTKNGESSDSEDDEMEFWRKEDFRANRLTRQRMDKTNESRPELADNIDE